MTISLPDPQSQITLAHGGGGKAMRVLIESVFAGRFASQNEEDQARLMDVALQAKGAQLAFTTDSFVVDPLEFPGGDIGKLAVCGTVNDLVVGGARPLWLSAAFIIEEGTEIALLKRIVQTMQDEAEKAGVQIVTGDTKVVDHGSADKIFITTSGIGVIPQGRKLGATQVRAGDVVIVTGEMGNHGATIMAARNEFSLSAQISSDCQSLGHLMEAALTAAPAISAARDATRGGVAATLNEIAQSSDLTIVIEETALPVKQEVRGLCDILGLDPLYLANEGTAVLFVSENQAEAALLAIRGCAEGRAAQIIGKVTEEKPALVVLRTAFGAKRIIDMPLGEQLPRIC